MTTNYPKSQTKLNETIKKADYAKLAMDNACIEYGITSNEANEARTGYKTIKNQLNEEYGIKHY